MRRPISPRETIAAFVQRRPTLVSIFVLAAIIVATLPTMRPRETFDAFAAWAATLRAAQGVPQAARPQLLRIEIIPQTINPGEDELDDGANAELAGQFQPLPMKS